MGTSGKASVGDIGVSLKGGKCTSGVVWGKTISDGGGDGGGDERTGPGALGRSAGQVPAAPSPARPWGGSALGFYSWELTCLRAFSRD